jgi:hypothetical protein
VRDQALCSYLVGFDINDEGISYYRMDPLVMKILSALHEFAYGVHEGEQTDNTQTLTKIVDAARSIYKIDEYQKVKDIYLNSGDLTDDVANKYLKRGEFGELILHLILKISIIQSRFFPKFILKTLSDIPYTASMLCI